MDAKREIMTSVRDDSQLGQAWARSRSVKEVRTSNFPAHSAH